MTRDQDPRVANALLAAIEEASARTEALEHTHPRELYDVGAGELAPAGACPMCDHLWNFRTWLHRRAT